MFSVGKSGTALWTLPLIHHRPHIILLLMALAPGCSICCSDLWQAAECWMEVYSVPAAPHIFNYWSSYLPIIWTPDTFDDIMWNRSQGRANETEWWMLWSVALTFANSCHRHRGWQETTEQSFHWGGLQVRVRQESTIKRHISVSANAVFWMLSLKRKQIDRKGGVLLFSCALSHTVGF